MDVMIFINKKKLQIANALRTIGMIFVVLCIPMFYFNVDTMIIYPILVVGTIIATWGGLKRTDLYLCPSCGQRILRGCSWTDQLFRRVPELCYNCGAHIDVVVKDEED